LVNDNGAKFSDFIYDKTLLEKTAVILAQNKNCIPEENIFSLVADYFKLLKKSKDIGRRKAEDWGYWRKELDIKKLLRNDNSKYCYIVISQDEPKEGELPLKDALAQALEIEDIWERKRKIRSLKPRLAKLTICVWANQDIVPEEIAEPLGCFYLLKDEYYTPGKGPILICLVRSTRRPPRPGGRTARLLPGHRQSQTLPGQLVLPSSSIKFRGSI